MDEMDMIFLYKDNLEEADLSFLEGHFSYENDTLTNKIEEEEMKPNE